MERKSLVVSICAERRRAPRCVRRLMCAVLVPGVAVILFAAAGLLRPSYAQDVPRESFRGKSFRGMPSPHWDMFKRSILGPSFGNLLLPLGAPSAGMRFATGSLRQTMNSEFVFNGLGSGAFGGAMTEPETQVSGPFSTTQGGSPVSIDTDATSDGLGLSPARLGLSTPARLGDLSTPARGRARWPRPLANPHAPRGIPVGCPDDQTESQLQAGGQFWTPQARSAAPVQFPGAVFIGSRLASKDPLGLGPMGHPVNVPPAGHAGSWCRPPSTPMSQSSPLEHRSFWIVLFFPLAVFLVFWASRGIRIRAVE